MGVHSSLYVHVHTEPSNSIGEECGPDNTEDKKANVGENMTLHCKCQADPGVDSFQIRWYKVGEDGMLVPRYTSRTGERDWDVPIQDSTVGGRYMCKCDPGSSKCFDIRGIGPYM